MATLHKRYEESSKEKERESRTKESNSRRKKTKGREHLQRSQLLISASAKKNA